MKTEMKKNNKAFLALVVVAALAAVSFAGIALSDDSDAALISNNIVIQPGETDAKDYSFYVLEGDEFFQAFEFVVMATGSYTGTISLGTASADMKTYTAYSSLKVTNGSAVRITGIMYNSPYTGEVVSVFMIGNVDKDVGGALPSGTFELTKGQIILGAPLGVTKTEWKYMEDELTISAYSVTSVLSDIKTGIDYLISNEKIVAFNGTVSAGDLSVTSSYTVGTMISLTAAGDARLSSFYMTASPNEALPNDPDKTTGAPLFFPNWADRTLSISGTASVQYPEGAQRILDRSIGDILTAWPGIMSSSYAPLFSDYFGVDAVNVTFEEGSVITIGDRASSVAQSVTIEGSNITFAYLIDGSGKAYESTISPTEANFGYVPFGAYTLILSMFGGGGELLFYGTASVSASGIAIGPNQLSSYAGGTGGGIAASELSIVSGELNYGLSAYYKFVFAFNKDNLEVGKLSADSDDVISIIEFPSGVTSTDEVFIVLIRSVAGNPPCSYFGTISANDAVGLVKVKTTTAALASDEIRAKSTFVIDDAIVTFVALDASKFLIKGEVNVLYNSATNYGVMDIANGDAYLDFEGTGILSYGVVPMAHPIEPAEILGGANANTRVNAAYFFENEPAAGIPTKTTYYFTTLDNALTLSGDITLNGKHVILKDTTFANPDFPTMRITLGPGAILEVGKIKDADSDAVSAILTIPAGTTVQVPDPSSSYEVVNGQAVYDVKPTIAGWEPKSDILLVRTEPAKFIYTDVGTALGISISGDVLDLRQDATLRSDATLKDGVTLNDVAHDLTIEEEVTLTVLGILNSKNDMVIKGTLVITGVANFTNVANAKLFGAIIVMPAGVLNVKDAAEISSGSSSATGAVDVAGKINLANTAEVNVGVITLTGTADIASTAKLSAIELLQIGAKPTISPLNGTYTNTAVINGKITLASGAIAYVYGDFTILTTGTNANLDTGSSVYKTEYMIAEYPYVTLYTGVAGAPLLMLYEDQLVDIIIKDWNNERMLRGDSLRLALKDSPILSNVGAADWKVVYADYELKKYTVTFYYLQGMTWVCNGLDQSGGAAIQVEYGKTVSVTGVVQPGYETTSAGLVLRANNGAYQPGAAYKVTGDVNFTATGVQLATDDKGNDGLTLIEILLIIIVIIIAVIALIVAVRLLRS
jgi:hypothetical protein